MTLNQRTLNQVKHFPKLRWPKIREHSIKSSIFPSWDDLKSENTQSSQAFSQVEMTLNQRILNQVKYFPKLRWLQIREHLIKSSIFPSWDDLKSENTQSSQALSQSVFGKSFPQSACPTLRYILPEFGCRSSPLRRFHPNKISHKLWRTSCEKHFSNTF